MSVTFTASILLAGKTATGIQVPAEIVAALGSARNPKVKVSLNGYTYRGSVQFYGGEFLLSLSAEHREAAGLVAGDSVEVTLELDLEPRTVDIPADLDAALSAEGLLGAFGDLSYTMRKEYARQVTEAKASETRARRISGILAKLRPAPVKPRGGES